MSKSTPYIVTGGLLGILAALLSYYGNPANMGICAACFLRDTAGALGLHETATVQYLRPEILGLIIGGFIASLVFKSSENTAISAPIQRLLLGIFAMIGCLIFLGCPWRAYLRLGGGDLSALAGIAGLVLGVFMGRFLKARGYALKEIKNSSKISGFIPVLVAVVLLIAVSMDLKLGENLPLFSSEKGPGSQRSAIIISALFTVVVGFAVFKSKFCTMGAISRALDRDFSMFYGVVALVVGATVVNLIISRYTLGFEAQPIAHNDIVFNLLAMSMAGLCFSLASGCPGKHLAQMGGGNLNSAIFVLGMLIGGALSHNLALASSPKGVTSYALYAIIAGFIVAFSIGFLNKKSI